jgi:formylglycine-generating enzyme required for sulfatase activity
VREAPDTTRLDVAGPLADLVRWDAASSDERRRIAEAVAARERDFVLVSLAAFEAGGVRHEVALFRHEPTELEFVLVPGGTIREARPTGPLGSSDRTPRRPDADGRIAVGPFLVARTPVTQDAWRRVDATNPSCFVGGRLPVEQVDLAAAEAFCAAGGLALPTEREWEHACRAGTESAWCCGDESVLPEFAWFDRNAGRSTHPVAEKKPNAFGLFDVVGNVWEWCRLDEAAAVREPRIRGGAWTSDARQLQSSWGLSYPASTRMGILGFRPVRELPADWRTIR